jgi:hypothetical protein
MRISRVFASAVCVVGCDLEHIILVDHKHTHTHTHTHSEGVDDARFEGCRGLFLKETADGDYVVEVVVNRALEEIRIDPSCCRFPMGPLTLRDPGDTVVTEAEVVRLRVRRPTTHRRLQTVCVQV